MTVCPASGPVGTTVILSGTGCHNPGSPDVLGVFLGPHAYMGSGGGGVEVNIPVGPHGSFRGTYTIPASYGGSQQWNGQPQPTNPGTHYAFSVDPAAECTVPFTVTAP